MENKETFETLGGAGKNEFSQEIQNMYLRPLLSV